MMTKTKSSGFEPPPPLDLRVLDLRPQGEANSTAIILHADYRGHDWINATQVSLTRQDSAMRGTWLLDVRLSHATDFEHDAAIALRMILHGVALRMVHSGRVWIDGFIDGDDPGSFRIPEPGWNQLEGATKCKACKDRKHLIVDEGRYIPVPNLALFERLRGLRVEIVTWREP